MIGVVFAEESEARTFHKKVAGRKAEKGAQWLLVRLTRNSSLTIG